MMKLHFKVYDDYSQPMSQKKLQVYLQDENGKIYIVNCVNFIECEKGVWCPPLNDLIPDLVIDDEILKKMSKELYSELEEETAYLKGNLEATQRHLEDMRTLALKK